MTNKTPISKAHTFQEIVAFWDEHDAPEFGKQKEVDFNVNIKSQRRYYPLDGYLSLRIREIVEEHGISEETLLNLWVQEKIYQADSKHND